MIVYAIIHAPSGRYLPKAKGRKGGTHVEPEKDCIPRLFKRESDAKTCLNWWLRGKVEPELETDEWGGGQYSIGPGTVKLVPSRNPDEMEVVEMLLDQSINLEYR